MKNSKRKIWLWILLTCFTFWVIVHIGRSFFLEEERQARIEVREAIIKKYPDAAQKINNTFGIKLFNSKKPVPKPQNQRGDIVLIHGLDEPGKVWMNLAPALAVEDFLVWIMTYPNDQPITNSAFFFKEQLAERLSKDVKNISIIGHSMGGLVTREMLTNPNINYMAAMQEGRLPRVEQVIMVGTPNHGSELARFRMFTEFRDQIKNMSNENYHFLHGIIDGAGEAGIDLIPGSTFLKELNSRPNPSSIQLTVIAGIMTAQERLHLDGISKKIRSYFPTSARKIAEKVEILLLTTSNQIGDGLVPLESARLADVPLLTVQGTHLSMIRNIRPESQRVPPAVPLIIKQLQN